MIINSREQSGVTVFDILEYEEVDDLKVICDILGNKYKIEVSGRLEGPGTTIWDIMINGYQFKLVNNSYGNFFRPQDKMSELFMEQEIPVIESLR